MQTVDILSVATNAIGKARVKARDRDDARQAVVLRLLERQHTWAHAENAEHYAYKIAYSAISDWRRTDRLVRIPQHAWTCQNPEIIEARERAMNTFALTEDVPRRVSAHSEEDRDEYLQSLRALLRSVPRRVRIVIALRLRGWTYQRIGKKYGRSKQWAKELLGQYRDRMRLALER